MTDDIETLKTLDSAVRAHAEDLVDDGEVITDWIVLAATRRFDGGGVVIHLLSDDGLPTYVLRGMLSESMATVDRRQAELEGGTDETDG